MAQSVFEKLEKYTNKMEVPPFLPHVQKKANLKYFRKCVLYENWVKISVSEEDFQEIDNAERHGFPAPGVIGIDPSNLNDQWYVNEAYYQAHYEHFVE